jgi:hypothetical protein
VLFSEEETMRSRKVCIGCGIRVDTPARNARAANSESVVCKDCNTTYYCSSKCYDDHILHHLETCYGLANIILDDTDAKRVFWCLAVAACAPVIQHQYYTVLMNRLSLKVGLTDESKNQLQREHEARLSPDYLEKKQLCIEGRLFYSEADREKKYKSMVEAAAKAERPVPPPLTGRIMTRKEFREYHKYKTKVDEPHFKKLAEVARRRGALFKHETESGMGAYRAATLSQKQFEELDENKDAKKTDGAAAAPAAPTAPPAAAAAPAAPPPPPPPPPPSTPPS